MADKAEALLKKLRRLSANMKCPNCGTAAPQGIGFGNVCIKYKTFICDLCKTSHQAISHRVKSFSMSSWTMEEVLDLTIEQNGGNEVALHVWLGNAPPYGGRYPGGTRPKEGDKIDIFKKFITDCYEHGKFKSSEPLTPSSHSQVEDKSPKNIPNKSRPVTPPLQSVRVHTPTVFASATTSTPQKVAATSSIVDLLAFDSPREEISFSIDFDTAFMPAAPVQSSSIPAVNNDFLLAFDDFPASRPPSLPPSHPKYSVASLPFDSFAPSSNDSGYGINGTYTGNSQQHLGQPVSNKSNSLLDPFAHSMVSSLSMPCFPVVSREIGTPSSAEGGGQVKNEQARPKSSIDLASLYNQPAQSAQQPQTNRGQGSSSDAISGISSAFSAITMNSYQAPISNFGQSYNSQQHQGNMGMGHMGGANPNPMSSQMGSQMNSQRGIQMNPQSNSGSSISMTGGQMSNQMGGQIGSQMNAPMSSSNSMGYMNPHANSSSSMGMGSRGPASMQYGRGLGGQGDVSPTNGNSMVGNYHSQQSQPQHQQQQQQLQQQQLQQQQQQQQHQQQQSHQQPYRGMTTTQNTPKAPIDSFGFISSTITSQIQNSSLQKSQMSGSNPNPALGSMSQNTTQYRG